MPTKPNRQVILEKYDSHCSYCGDDITLKSMQVDHLMPQRLEYRNGSDAIHCEKNYMPSCRSCNNYKSGNPLESFRKMVSKQIEILRRDRPTFRMAERFGLIECKPKNVVFYFEQHITRPNIDN